MTDLLRGETHELVTTVISRATGIATVMTSPNTTAATVHVEDHRHRPPPGGTDMG
jgi:hypothetical protein